MSSFDLSSSPKEEAGTPLSGARSGTPGPSPYRRQLSVLSFTAVVGVVVAAIGISGIWASDFVQYGAPQKGGPVRGYDWWNLIALILWLVALPVAMGMSLKSALLAYKMPEASTLSRSATTLLLAICGLVIAFVGYYQLQGQQMLACGFFWCINAEPDTADPSGFMGVTGASVFFLGLIFAFLMAFLFYRTLFRSVAGTAAASQDTMTSMMRRAQRNKMVMQRVAGLSLLLGIPLMLVMTGLLPNTWERFSLNAKGGSFHSIKYYASASGGINGTMPFMQSEKPGAWMVTQNWRWSDDVVVKFFPDTLLFYVFLEGIAIVTVAQAMFPGVKGGLERRVGPLSVGRALLLVWFIAYLILFIYYWAVDHLYHGDGKFNDFSVEVAARTSGLVAASTMGLLLLPASKSSPVLAAAGISWESALWVHIGLGVLFLFSSVLHVALYFVRFVQLGYGADILPFNAMFWYPQNPIGGTTPSDNWAVPMMATVFWPSLIIFGVFPWMRRTRYELFRYTHNAFMVLIPATFWHATNSWYFLLPGVTLWVVDRMLRFLNATECVTIEDYKAHSVDCWTDARPGQESRNLAEKITKLAFSWPGQARVHSPGMYVLVNLPQVSLAEWHPFSLSSSPLDAVSTIHVKNMGPDTFTGKLHELAKQNPSCDNVLMNIQGPYGPQIDLHTLPRVVLIAGGIGVTPMVNSVRCAVQRAKAGNAGALQRLHFVWSARSPDVFEILTDELTLDTRGLPFELKISLYCSTIRAEKSCALGPVNAGMPDFAEILPAEAALGRCFVRACGPPNMVDSCSNVAKTLQDNIDFEPWSFVL